MREKLSLEISKGMMLLRKSVHERRRELLSNSLLSTTENSSHFPVTVDSYDMLLFI
jgi:hypothetical protein